MFFLLRLFFLYQKELGVVECSYIIKRFYLVISRMSMLTIKTFRELPISRHFWTLVNEEPVANSFQQKDVYTIKFTLCLLVNAIPKWQYSYQTQVENSAD